MWSDVFYLLVIAGLIFAFTYKPKNSLRYYRVDSKAIDSVLFGELWILRKAYWPDDHKKNFIAYIKECKSTWILFRDQADGSLRGAYIEDIVDGEIDGQKYRTCYIGHLFFYTFYRGNPILAMALLNSYFTTWWNAPKGVRVFSVFSAISYKSYLLAANTYPNMYPTVKNWDKEKFKYEVSMTNNVMSRLYPQYWNGSLIQIPGVKLDVAPVTEDMIKNHEGIRFFVERNPTSETGTALPCVFEITPKSIVDTITSTIRRAIFYSSSNKSNSSSRSDHKQRKPRPKQRDLARTYTIPYETEISRTFNLQEKSKENVKKFVGRLKKSGSPSPSPKTE